MRLPTCDVLRALLATAPRAERLDAVDADGRTALHHAATLDRSEAVSLLAAAGAHMDARTQAPRCRTALHAAAYGGHTETVRTLLSAGASPHLADGAGDTPAHDAAARGHTEALAVLVGEGVELEKQNAEGKTVAALVRSHTALEMVRLPLLGAMEREDAAAEATKLCALGHSPNMGDGLLGRTPLHAAAMRDDVAAVRALLAAGALPDIRDRDGNTALHYGAGYGASGVVSALLDAGADMTLRNRRGFAPFELVPLPPQLPLLLPPPPEELPEELPPAPRVHKHHHRRSTLAREQEGADPGRSRGA